MQIQCFKLNPLSTPIISYALRKWATRSYLLNIKIIIDSFLIFGITTGLLPRFLLIKRLEMREHQVENDTFTNITIKLQD